MNRINDGGAAFPRVDGINLETGEIVTERGMSLRDWFAGTLTVDDDYGRETAEAIMDGEKAPPWKTDPVVALKWWARVRARIRYMEADAMIAEGAKK